MKKGILALLIFALIFAAGCSNLFGQSNGSTRGRGLSLSFVPGFPTNPIYEGVDFKVGIELINYGRETVNGEVCIYDELHSSYGGIDEKRCEQFTLESFDDSGGRQIGTSEGEPEYVYNGIGKDGFDNEIVAEISYAYRALITQQIKLCNDQRQCSLQESIGGLGGDAATSPVTVTRINKILSPKSNGAGVILDIDVENVGGGKVISSSANDDVEKVEFNIDSPGIIFNCRTDGGIIILNDRKKTVRCTGDAILEGSTPQNNPVDIELRYNYWVEKRLKTRVEKF